MLYSSIDSTSKGQTQRCPPRETYICYRAHRKIRCRRAAPEGSKSIVLIDLRSNFAVWNSGQDLLLVTVLCFVAKGIDLIDIEHVLRETLRFSTGRCIFFLTNVLHVLYSMIGFPRGLWCFTY